MHVVPEKCKEPGIPGLSQIHEVPEEPYQPGMPKVPKVSWHLAIEENLQSKVYLNCLQCKSNVKYMQHFVDLNYILIFLYIKYLEFSEYMNYI